MPANSSVSILSYQHSNAPMLTCLPLPFPPDPIPLAQSLPTTSVVHTHQEAGMVPDIWLVPDRSRLVREARLDQKAGSCRSTKGGG